MRRINRYAEAFKENFNTIGLATAAALSAATLTPIPLLVGLVAEAAYLLFVPDSKWYEARLAKKFDAEVEARRRQFRDSILPTLRPEVQARFIRLEETRSQIDAQSQNDKDWFREVLRKLDYLLEKFLQFAGREAQFLSYLEQLREEIHEEAHPVRGETGRGKGRIEFDIAERWVSGDPDRALPRRKQRENGGEKRERPAALDAGDRRVEMLVADVQAHYAREQEGVQSLLAADPDADTYAVLKKRAEVLQRRHDYAGKIGKILLNVNHQLNLLEDTFGLINDEIRARTPEQVLADIEEVVVATNTMASALEELAPYEQLAARSG